MALYAIDGTWNQRSDEVGRETNVVEFCEIYRGEGQYYSPGVGTRFGVTGKMFGGALGAGGRERVRTAYTEVCQRYVEKNDRVIDIVGFSRGAALALHLANVIALKGIQDPKTRQTIEPNPSIRFLGLWDAVAAFGVPIDIASIPFQSINLGFKLDRPGNVQHCFHAMALDERRESFRVTRVRAAYEVWFRGVHSDIGGGNANTGLSNIPLRWMLRKATAAGLPIDQAELALLKVDPNAALVEPTDPRVDPLRQVEPDDRIHYTVTPRPGGRCNNPADDCVRETEDAESAV
jgi:uncharacterized protein (DUF2235 family)